MLLAAAEKVPRYSRQWLEGEIKTCDRWIEHYEALIAAADDAWLDERFLRGN